MAAEQTDDEQQEQCWKCFNTREYCYTCGEVPMACACEGLEQHIGRCEECDD